MWIDTHCHLDITESFGIPIKIALENSKENSISVIIQIATSEESSRWNQKFIQNYYLAPTDHVKVYYTIGLHPESIQQSKKEEIQQIQKLIQQSSDDPYFVGIGETGLDYFYNSETKELQLESFFEHLQLAKKLELPIIVHCRDDKQYNEEKTEAIEEIFRLAKEVSYPNGIMHCYTYSYKEAKWFLELDWKISFSGIVTFKNAKVIQEAAQKIPLENLLIETDSPFLAPVPKRGKTNEPANLIYIGEFIANLRNIPKEEFLLQLQKNVKETFKKISIEK
ncbi:MAG: TatD family hydrolase [Leptospiraceae bacterium]|nr:TatD family hydrolase [Leptospiraceae bacterium]MDW7975478.1 TatD family hydrolase [Leptospiraceae bacterium]